MANKKTQVELYKELRALAQTQEQIDFIDKKIEQVEKKNATKGETATQKANAVTLDIIKDTLAKFDIPIRISELQDADERLAMTEKGEPISNQKISALLKKLVDNGEVVKTIEKKIAYFKIAE